MGILLAQEFILAERGAGGFGVVEDAALFCEQVGYGGDCGRGFGCAGLVVVDGAEGVECLFIAVAGALPGGQSFEPVAELNCVFPGVDGAFATNVALRGGGQWCE
jgi:hypothetical protein